MNVDVSTSIVIHRPCALVADFVSNPDNARDWCVNIKSVEWKTPPPVRIGSRIAFVAQFLGRRLEYTYEVIDLVPMGRLVMRTVEGPFPMETTYSWAAISERETHMTLRNRGAPTGFSSFVTPIMRFAMRRANERDLAALKLLLETGR